MRFDGSRDAAAHPLKICFVVNHRMDGGAARALSELAGTLADLGQEVTVIHRDRTEWAYPISGKVALRVLDRPRSARLRKLKLRWLEYFWLLYQEVRALEPDVLVPYLQWAEAYSFPVAKLGRSKLLYTVRCDPEVFPAKKRERLIRDIRCFFSDKIYVQNKAEAAYFPTFMQKKIFVLPNIVRQEFFQLERPKTGEIRHFVSAARLAPQKNLPMLIGAFSRLAKRYPQRGLSLTIWGRGELRQQLEALIRQLGMQEHISLMGFAEDLCAEYAKADAFVLTSDYEGQPNVLMEAMAAGLPCISTDCPTGPAELIESGINGVLIPCGDEQALEAEMERFITAPSAAQALGENARAHMKTLYDREKIGRAFIAQCMELRRGRSCS